MINRRSVVSAIGAVAVAAVGESALAEVLTGESISIVGTGALGGALGRRLGSMGYPIVYGSRTPQDQRVRTLIQNSGAHAWAASPSEAVLGTSVVILAMPWEAAKSLVPELGSLKDKTVIDPMNWKFQIIDHYPYRPEPASSIGEALQAMIPDAHIVKAFNAISSNAISNPRTDGGRLTIPLAGANAQAKAFAASLISGMGFDPVNAGPLIAARFMEDLLLLETGCAMYNNGSLFELSFRRVAVKS